MKAILQLLRAWRAMRGAHYDPVTKRLSVPPNAPAYAFFHEAAHLEQDADGSLLCRAWRRTYRLPWIRSVVRLLLEIDADRRARSSMRVCGAWDNEARALSGLVLLRYVLQLLLP